MAGADLILPRPARLFYNEVATAEERFRIDRILEQISLDPAPDERVKFAFGSPAEGGLMYNDRTFWITYRMLNNWTLAIMGIGTVGDTAVT